MKSIDWYVKWIMLVSGVLTATMFYGVFAPQAALESMFGASFNGVLQGVVVRSWSALVGLMGLVLISGFLNPAVRRYSMTIAATSKLVFVTLVVLYGQAFFEQLAAAIVMDVMVIVVAVLYWFAPRVVVEDSE
jgi:hypothetical protein